MKSSWRSPDGGSSVARNTKIEPCGAVFCAWWGTGSTPIRSFHTVSEGEFSEVRGGVGEMASWVWRGLACLGSGLGRRASRGSERAQEAPYLSGGRHPSSHLGHNSQGDGRELRRRLYDHRGAHSSR